LLAARVDGVLACCLFWLLATLERRFVPFF